MGTKVSVIYKVSKIHEDRKKYDFEKPLYFKEDSSKVLREFIPKYNVCKFNSIDLSDRPFMRVPIVLLKKGVSTSNMIDVDGIYIQNFYDESLEISKSISNFNFENKDFKMIERKASPEINKIIYDITRRYMISTKVIDSGSATQGLVRKTIGRMGKQKAINYLKTRKRKKDSKKEKYLEDILLYGKAVLGRNFDINYLNSIAEEIVEEIPEECEPTRVFYATLRRSHY